MIALSWSGGKDSALALRELRRAGTPPDVLLTTHVGPTVPHHEVPLELVREQAAAAGLPLVEVEVDADYEAAMEAALTRHALSAVAFGDLFLEDIRAYRETRLSAVGVQAWFPLWGRDTAALAREFVDAGFRATVTWADDPGLVGREYDHELIDALRPGVDPCGENGEFHTFVWAGPVFGRSVRLAGAALDAQRPPARGEAERDERERDDVAPPARQ